MSYKVYARKYRPTTFKEVSSQEHIVRILENSIVSSKISHAYLFSGERGVGKTTLARLFAKALNCKSGPTIQPCNECSSCKDIAAGGSLDVVEIDGASNTGVDDVRKLIERVQYRPVEGQFKIFIIDEVHMLSTSAFNALLKTIEEPPPGCLFIFATTELHKIPATILSRCQHFVFRRIPFSGMISRLKTVCSSEGLDVSEKGLFYICRLAEGSLRDALSLLDQTVSYSAGNSISEEDIISVFGLCSMDSIYALGNAVLKGDSATALTRLKELYDRGIEIRRLSMDLAEYFRNLTMVLLSENPGTLVNLPQQELQEITNIAAQYDSVHIERLFNLFIKTSNEIRNVCNQYYFLELAFIKGASYKKIKSFEDLRRMLKDIENRVGINEAVSSNTAPGFKTVQSSPPSAKMERTAGELERLKNQHDPSPVPSSEIIDSDNSLTPKANSHEKKTDETGVDWKLVLKDIEEEKTGLWSKLEDGVVIKCNKENLELGFKKSFFDMREVTEGDIETIGFYFKRRYAILPNIKVVTLEGKPANGKNAISAREEAEIEKKASLDRKLTEYSQDPLVKKVLESFPNSKLRIIE